MASCEDVHCKYCILCIFSVVLLGLLVAFGFGIYFVTSDKSKYYLGVLLLPFGFAALLFIIAAICVYTCDCIVNNCGKCCQDDKEAREQVNGEEEATGQISRPSAQNPPQTLHPVEYQNVNLPEYEQEVPPPPYTSPPSFHPRGLPPSYEEVVGAWRLSV